MARYAARPGVMARELDNEMVLLDTASGTYFRLNSTGALLWSHLDVPASVEELVEVLTAATDVPVHVAQQDVAELVQHLEDRGLISVTG